MKLLRSSCENLKLLKNSTKQYFLRNRLAGNDGAIIFPECLFYASFLYIQTSINVYINFEAFL